MIGNDEFKALYAKIFDKVPRLPLSFLPTPLHPLHGILEKTGVDILIKRDDMTGIEFGGNKTRKLEFVLTRVLQQNADYVLTGASVQSNWCRQLVSACIQLGIKPILYLYGSKIPDEYTGNMLLYKTLGAEVHFFALKEGENMYGGLKRTEAIRNERLKEIEKQGKTGMYLTVGAPEPLGHIAYVNAMFELALQLEEMNLTLDDIDYIVTPIGSGGTYIGLLLGTKLLKAKTKIMGFCTSDMHPTMETVIKDGCQEVIDCFSLPIECTEGDILVSFDYGGIYDTPTLGSTNAIKTVARTSAVLLDPVYTAKAMHGLLDKIEKGIIKPGSRVVFWHTGGLPALFSGEEIAGKIYS